MKPCFFIQFGYPGETKEDIRKTINMINELLPYDIGISVSYPLPGTKFFENVQSQLKEKTNWTDSDELVLMFRNTYEPSFYKLLHRYVHASFHKAAGVQAWRNLLNNAPANNGAFRKVLKTPYYFYNEFVQRRKLKAFEF